MPDTPEFQPELHHAVTCWSVQPNATGEANPTALPKLVNDDEVERKRSLFCASYDRCLDVAIRQKWSSWTCEFCMHFIQAGDNDGAAIDDEAVLRPLAE